MYPAAYKMVIYGVNVKEQLLLNCCILFHFAVTQKSIPDKNDEHKIHFSG